MRSVDKSLPDQEGENYGERISIFVYPFYKHEWRNVGMIYTHKTRLASNEIFSPPNKVHREVGQAKDLSAPLYK